MKKQSTMRLGDLEKLIMDRLWETDRPQSVRDVYTELAAQRELAYTTVMTVLDRLAKKELVLRERDGRAWRYRPAQSRDELAAEMMDAVLGDDAGERSAALVAFADRVSPAEAALLRRALAGLEAAGADRRGED